MEEIFGNGHIKMEYLGDYKESGGKEGASHTIGRNRRKW